MKNQKSYTPKKSRYKNDLPHWQWENAIYFVTFRLHGSLPKLAIQILKDEQELQRKKLIKKGLPEHEIKTALKKMHHLYFGKFDHLLDNSNSGPHYLSKNCFAKIVADAIMFFNEKKYVIINYTIMSNHVHLMIYKLQTELHEIMGTIKKYSAKHINLELKQTGNKFWQYESFDHIIRNEQELNYYIQYNLLNPVTANLISNWRDWKWNYIHKDFLKYTPT
jgi:REP element-mobilizing transposase RayT